MNITTLFRLSLASVGLVMTWPAVVQAMVSGTTLIVGEGANEVDKKQIYELSLNQYAVGWGADLTILPGQVNVLSLRIDPGNNAATEYIVTVEKTLPDDTMEALSASIEPGQTHEFDLGPMTAPPRYIFEAGAVFRVGYQIEITVADAISHPVFFRRIWRQGLRAGEPIAINTSRAAPMQAGPERLVAGGARFVPYNPKFAVEAALDLRLDETVLSNPDDVRARFRLNRGALVERLACRLIATTAEGTILLDEPVTAEQRENARSVNVRDWPVGDYRLALYPETAGRVWAEGPVLTYHRRALPKGAVRINRFAPWTLQRDTTREEESVVDLRRAVQSTGEAPLPGWTFNRTEEGFALATKPGEGAGSLSLDLTAPGLYAIFATPYAHGCLFQAGDDPLVRTLVGPNADGRINNNVMSQITPGEVFVTVADMSSQPIHILPFGSYIKGEVVSGLAGLRLVPVTAESVREFREAVANPPIPLYGVNDWGVFFSNFGRPVPPRMEPDSYDAIIGGQSEIGLRTIDWSVGRSIVLYATQLPNARWIPSGPPGLDPLEEALRCGKTYNARIRAWFALMYYGDKTPWDDGWGHPERAAPLFRQHPEYRRWLKNAPEPDDGRGGGGALLSFYFPEVRRDKTDILLEVAERGADGVLVGTCRLVPMMCYHPKMVAEYRGKFGIDPLAIDSARDASQAEAYRHWIAWRADFFTQLLRELKAGLSMIEEKQGRRVPVTVRIPSTGLFFNLAQGLDVEQWLREGLIDQVQLDPLERTGGDASNSHDVRPYLELGRRYGVPVVGGLGKTWMDRPEGWLIAQRRVLGLLEAGVDGIELYESEILARCSSHRWLVPLFGNAARLRSHLTESNLEACHPVTASTCMYGYDNVSRWVIKDAREDEHYVWVTHGIGSDCL